MYLSYQLKIINKAKPFTKVLIWIVLIPNLLLWMLIVATSGPVSIVHISSASANGHTYHLTKIVYSPTDDAIEKIVAFECNFAGIICHLTNPASKLSFDSNNNTVSLTPTDQPVTVKFDLRNVNQELKDLVLRGVFRG